MEDYIDILLEYLADQRSKYLGHEYFLQQARENSAFEALLQTFSEEQHDLFLSYEEERNACFAISESAYARQAFLLAREIYR